MAGYCQRSRLAPQRQARPQRAPACGRAGLYKQLAELRALVTEFREDPAAGEGLRVSPDAVACLQFVL